MENTEKKHAYTCNVGFKQLLFVAQTSSGFGKATTLAEAIRLAKLYSRKGAKISQIDIYHLKTDLLKNQVNKEAVKKALDSIVVTEFSITDSNDFVYRISSEPMLKKK